MSASGTGFLAYRNNFDMIPLENILSGSNDFLEMPSHAKGHLSGVDQDLLWSLKEFLLRV